MLRARRISYAVRRSRRRANNYRYGRCPTRRHGSRRLLDDVLLAPETFDRGWWRPDGLRRIAGEHLAGRANHASTLGVVLTLELFARQALSAAGTPALQKSA